MTDAKTGRMQISLNERGTITDEDVNWERQLERPCQCAVMTLLLHALPRRHPWPECSGHLPLAVNASDNLLLCSSHVKGKLREMLSSCLKTAFHALATCVVFMCLSDLVPGALALTLPVDPAGLLLQCWWC